MATALSQNLQRIAPIGWGIPDGVLATWHQVTEVLTGLPALARRQQVVGLHIFQWHCSLFPDLWANHTARCHCCAS